MKKVDLFSLKPEQCSLPKKRSMLKSLVAKPSRFCLAALYAIAD